jgi:hypothetical protein
MCLSCSAPSQQLASDFPLVSGEREFNRRCDDCLTERAPDCLSKQRRNCVADLPEAVGRLSREAEIVWKRLDPRSFPYR